MPELPEVEHLRRTLEPLLVGVSVVEARLIRADIARRGDEGVSARPVSRRELLQGATIKALRRHGKQLAIVGDRGVLCVQLGMSGQLRWAGKRERVSLSNHVHCRWRLAAPGREGRLLFRDPRRFGGLVALESLEALSARWARLGPDALTIGSRTLQTRLRGRCRPIKAALLDQGVVAGVGNIYADECLFDAAVHPCSMCDALPADRVTALARAMRRILARAIEAGGTTLRDYVDADGRSGDFVQRHRVYGRAGLPCARCRRPLERVEVAQRTTTYCERCQRLFVG